MIIHIHKNVGNNFRQACHYETVAQKLVFIRFLI